MADTSEEHSPVPDREKRKSVAFNDAAIVVEADGTTTMASTEDSKDTAVSHSPSTPPLSAALGAFTDPSQAPVEEEEPGADLSSLPKKKKKKAPKAEDDGAEAPAETGEDGLALPMKKKKKKKTAKEESDELAAKIAALEVDGDEEAEGDAEPQEEQSGDMDAGTGIWQHDGSKPIVYNLLLNRFFSLLSQKNPDHASSGSRSYKIPPPQCLREGNKKTIFANIPEICKRMKRTEEHVTQYLFSELGTNGSVDGSRRLVIKGRFQQKQIENVLRKYIMEYVTCKTCRSADTNLERGENRLYFITCNPCGSRRSVQAIKTGFTAQIGKRRKMRA